MLDVYDTSFDFPLNEALETAFHTPPKASYCDKVTILDLLKENSPYLEGECVTLVAVVVEVSVSYQTIALYQITS